MDQLKKQRKPLKSKISRISNWLRDNSAQETDPLQFQLRSTELKNCYAKYDDLMDQIEELDEANTEERDREDIEEKYFSTLAGLQHRMEMLQPLSHQSSSTSPRLTSAKVTLPEIKIQTFSGCFSEWSAFYQLFETLIINNPELNNVQRFVYLKSFLRNEPLQLVENIQVLEENFQIALDTLRNRYENKSRVISLLIQRLLKVPSLVKTNAKALREFLVTAKQTLLALKNMNVPIEHWDLLLIEIFLQKVDFTTHRSFEYELGSKDIPTLNQFFDFLEKKCDIMEKLNSSDNTDKKVIKTHAKTVLFSSASNKNNSYSKTCVFCNNATYSIYACTKFANLFLQDKYKFVNENKLCRNCLGTKHFSLDCSSQRLCSICKKRHHTLLHNDHQNSSSSSRSFQRQNHATSRNVQNTWSDGEAGPSNSVSRSATQTSQVSNVMTSLSALSIKQDVLLATALVTIYSKHGVIIHARCILDSGSQSSFVSKDLVQKLNLSPYSKRLQISTISEHSLFSNKMVDLEIFPYRRNGNGFKISCAILDNITCRLPQVSINRSKFNIPSTVTLADPTYSVPGNIDLLLASDIYSELLSDGLIRLGKGLPVLQNTHLGYIMFGSLPPYALHKGIYRSQLSPTQSNVYLFVQSTSEEDKLDNIIRQFFEIEEVTPSVKISSSEDLAEQIFTETTQILPSGRFQVKLPLISETAHKMLGNSYNMARKRFISLENKLLKHENVYSQYKAFINEYVSLGHAKKVPLSLTNVHLENKYFLPHHSVIKEESLTTKLRVVFDGSMKSSSGYSLNDILLKGKTLQPELFDILLRFRLYTYVFTSDIQKMYRQVQIHPDHTFLQNILWRDSPEQDIECLELQTVTYGTKSASFQSTRCLMELAKTHQNNYPLASDALLTGCYVDDILYGANDTQTLLKAHNEITDLLNKTITLPRLELMGALLASKLTTKVVDIIKDKLPSINMWSDSEIVLAWLRSHHSRWNQFVANRVAQIQENSSHSHWRHVKSKDNPADILSRGMMPSNILNSTLWFHGPQFLQTFDLNLSEYSPKFNSNKLPEERKVVLHTRSAQFDFFVMLSERFSSFTKYVRTIAYVLRFGNNAKSVTQKLSGALEVSELQNAEMKIIKLLQNSSFSSEIADLKGNKIISNKSLLQFAPFLDKNEMLRVGGRLRYSEVTFDQKYPLLLPSKNHVVRLILKKEHLRLHHAGPQNTLSQVRLRYWPLNGLREIKRIVHECHVCFKFNAKPLAQIMSDLPKERLCSAQVFAHAFLASSQIRWKTIPPRSPHHGGLWESAKHHIYRLLGNLKITFEEFSTVLTQIEAVLNSRPICALSNDPSDFTYLTPGHFLIGRSLTSLPDQEYTSIPENRLSIWQNLSKLQQLFWKKWSTDYLNRLQNRPKWFLPFKNLEPNDLVLVKEDNLPPLYWSLARVMDVFPGKDGRVRIASVKTKDGIFKRTITKLCPLPSEGLC
ncbi:uncharacterized protein [Diabrotica undecimpunctata]|uniref:uncharacterized protein n=1 Tax=Diabrotica undecimpunctata TaxID=50387 RepID=UPI003B64231B